MPDEWSDVFISYNAAADADIGTRLLAGFSDAGLRCWIYTVHTLHGSPHDETTDAIIRDCRLFVGVFSCSYFLHNNCVQELATARGRVAREHEDTQLGTTQRLILTGVLVDDDVRGLVRRALERLPYAPRILLSGAANVQRTSAPLERDPRSPLERASGQLDFNGWVTTLAQQLERHAPTKLKPPPPQALSVARTADGRLVTIAARIDHPQSAEVRHELNKHFTSTSPMGTWVVPYETYLEIVIPLLEALCGRGCCPLV